MKTVPKLGLDRSTLLVGIASLLIGALLIGMVWLVSAKLFQDEIPMAKNGTSQKAKKDSSELTKESALTFVNDFLNDGALIASQMEDSNKEFKKIAAGDFTKVPQAYRDQFRWVDFYEKDSEVIGAALVATLYIGEKAKEVAKAQGSDIIGPWSSNPERDVFLDKEMGIAFVPLGIYLGSQSGMSIELVAVDGKWKIAPYSLISAIQASQNAATEKAAQ